MWIPSLFLTVFPAPNTVPGTWMNEVTFKEGMNQPTWWNAFAIYRPHPAPEICEEWPHSTLAWRDTWGQKARGRIYYFLTSTIRRLNNNNIWSLDPFSFFSPYHLPLPESLQAYFGYLGILKDVLFSFLWTFCYENFSKTWKPSNTKAMSFQCLTWPIWPYGNAILPDYYVLLSRS